MASLMSIPTEILLEIVKLILDECLLPPIVGQDAASVIPPESQIRWKMSLKKRIIQRMPWNSSKKKDKVQQNTQETATESVRQRYCALKALRSVNRSFNNLCQPFLYRQLNLLLDLKPNKLKMMRDIFTIPKWSLVQSISVYMDPSSAEADLHEPLALGPFIAQATGVAYVLEKCRNLTSLALYYRHPNVQMLLIRNVLLSLLRDGHLTALGFYSIRLLHNEAGYDDASGEVTNLVELLGIIALDEIARRRLRTLEVVADWIPAHTYDLIRSNFPSLESLTLRRVVRAPWFQSKIWDVDQQLKWHPYPNLTCLHLCDFQPGYSAHIPILVRHFTALKELKISACGSAYYGEINWRPPGWSRLQDALCNNHHALTTLDIEHMADWEVYELGIIPTTTAFVTMIKWHHLLELFRKDYELFPGLLSLRVAPLTSGKDDMAGSGPLDGKPSMETICDVRNVQLRYDAPTPKISCPCPWH